MGWIPGTGKGSPAFYFARRGEGDKPNMSLVSILSTHKSQTSQSDCEFHFFTDNRRLIQSLGFREVGIYEKDGQLNGRGTAHHRQQLSCEMKEQKSSRRFHLDVQLRRCFLEILEESGTKPSLHAVFGPSVDVASTIFPDPFHDNLGIREVTR